MCHKNRGKAIIFNHKHFVCRKLEPRLCAGLDCYNLEKSLKNLGFDIIPYVDLKVDELEKKVDYCKYEYNN